MTAQLIGTFEPDSQEWHEARAQGLGGSEIAAVLGLSRWQSHYSLWLQKAGIIPPEKQNKQMDAGKRLEPVILQWWHDQHPEIGDVRQGGSFRSEERSWQIANPDARAAQSEAQEAHAIVECKLALYDYEWGEPGSDQIPAYYLAQCQWYLDVFGLDTCYVAVFIGSQGEFREYVVKANPDDQAYMRAAGEAFIQSLADGKRPSIDEHDATYQAIRSEHPTIDRQLSVEIRPTLWDDYQTTRDEAELATAEHRRVKSYVLDVMGDARIATVGSEPVLRRQPGRGGAVSLQPVRKAKP